ncbi:unnamed protein product, partial [marine sediment metagenome]
MEYLQQVGDAFWQGLVPVMVAAFIGYLIKLAKEYRDQIKDERLRALIDELVRAAEQELG